MVISASLSKNPALVIVKILAKITSQVPFKVRITESDKLSKHKSPSSPVLAKARRMME
jgi:hypothetical protein